MGRHLQRTYDRVILEAGQDVAKTAPPNPVVGTQAFVDQLQTPDFPWTGLTITLVIGGVAVAAVLTRVLQLRARRSQKNTATPADQEKK